MLAISLLVSHSQAAPPSVSKDHTGLCQSDERPRFACAMKSGKQAALCQKGDALVYRFGIPGRIELELPREGQPAIDVARRQVAGDEEHHVASAWNDGHRYAVHSHRTEDQFELQVVVRKGAEKPLATLACKELLAVDFTEVDAFRAQPTRKEAWIGQWEAGDASFLIVEESGGLALREGQAFWRGANPGQIHTGEAAGTLARLGPDYLRYESDGCAIDLRYIKGALEVRDNLKCGGLNVTFSGSYHREP